MEYHIGHIYKIICSLDNDFIYIGSTFNELRHRFKKHKENYKCWVDNGRTTKFKHKYYYLVDKYGWENFKIVKIKSYSVVRLHNKDRKHLSVYETLWINKTKNCLSTIPFNPIKKLKKIRQDRIINPKYEKYACKNSAKYYDKNRDTIIKKMCMRNKVKVECPICKNIYTRGSLSKHIKRKHT